MSDGKSILVSKEASVMRIVINRPHIHNAIDLDMHHRLSDVFDEFANCAKLRVAVISGAGKHAFCAGSDLKNEMN